MTVDSRDLLAAFAAAGVRFLVVGAHALAAHGVPRATADLDVWIEPTEANADRAWRALIAFGAPLEALGVRLADFVRSDQVIQLGLPLEGTLSEVPVAFIGREAFLRNRRASGRPTDIEDARSLSCGE